MGLTAALRTLSDANVRKVAADPPLIWKVLAPNDHARYRRARGPTWMAAQQSDTRGFLARLLRPNAVTDDNELLVLAKDEVATCTIDKAWHGIHFLLTQTAWESEAPLNFLVSGGAPAGDAEGGPGPSRLFTAAQVKAIAAALAPIDAATLHHRFDPRLMLRLDIYPPIWDRDPVEQDVFAWCLAYFVILKKFVADAAARGMGMVVTVS